MNNTFDTISYLDLDNLMLEGYVVIPRRRPFINLFMNTRYNIEKKLEERRKKRNAGKRASEDS